MIEKQRPRPPTRPTRSSCILCHGREFISLTHSVLFINYILLCYEFTSFYFVIFSSSSFLSNVLFFHWDLFCMSTRENKFRSQQYRAGLLCQRGSSLWFMLFGHDIIPYKLYAILFIFTSLPNCHLKSFDIV